MELDSRYLSVSSVCVSLVQPWPWGSLGVPHPAGVPGCPPSLPSLPCHASPSCRQVPGVTHVTRHSAVPHLLSGNPPLPGALLAPVPPWQQELQPRLRTFSCGIQAALKKYQTEQRSKGDSLDKCQAELKKLRKKSQGSKNPQKYSDKELQVGLGTQHRLGGHQGVFAKAWARICCSLQGKGLFPWAQGREGLELLLPFAFTNGPKGS